MLKHTIDFYNFLLDIIDYIKRPSHRTKSLLAGILALIVAGGSYISAQAISGYVAADQQTRQSPDGQALPLTTSAGQTQKQATTQPGTTGSSGQMTGDPNSATNSKKSSSDAIKDSAAGQESPAAKSFRLTVKSTDTVTVGSLIAFDAVKNEKTFYAGKLVVGKDSITISKSAGGASVSAALQTASPDDMATTTPVQASDDKLTGFTIGLDASQSADQASKHTVAVSIAQDVAPGTYTLHLTANRVSQSQPEGTWTYHGFVTVVVTD